MRTAVNGWRWPYIFLYCFLRLKWKTRILSARPPSMTSPLTITSVPGPILPSPLETASTSLNSIVSPWLAGSFSILTTSPGETRYCFPPARITAYISLSSALFMYQSERQGLVYGLIRLLICYGLRLQAGTETTGKPCNFNVIARCGSNRSSHLDTEQSEVESTLYRR